MSRIVKKSFGFKKRLVSNGLQWLILYGVFLLPTHLYCLVHKILGASGKCLRKKFIRSPFLASCWCSQTIKLSSVDRD